VGKKEREAKLQLIKEKNGSEEIVTKRKLDN